MEVDKSKCLICEVSYGFRGPAFFKFPKDERMWKLWIKEISPLLKILKIHPRIARKYGRICARHFREKDFFDERQTSLIKHACPSLSVSNMNGTNLTNEDFEEFGGKEESSSSDSSDDSLGDEEEDSFSDTDPVEEKFFVDNDIFQCGRCKTQFERLKDFVIHKKEGCEPPQNIITNIKPEPENYFVSAQNSFFNKFNSQLSGGSVYDDQQAHCSSLVPSDALILNNSTLPMAGTSQTPVNYNGMILSNSAGLSQVLVTPTTGIVNKTESGMNNVLIPENDSDLEDMYPCAIVSKTETGMGDILIQEVAETTEPEILYQYPVEMEVPIHITTEPSNAIAIEGTSTGESTQTVEMKDKCNQTKDLKPRPQIPCSYCGKVFDKPFSVQQHERVHTGERPFQCIICGRAFTQKSNVRKHMTRHRVWPNGKQTLKANKHGRLSGQNVYSCQYCTMSFSNYAQHKRHLSVHSNYKVYRCIQKNCNQTFSDLDEFLCHSKTHTRVEFQCHRCLKVYTTLEDLGAHQYEHDTTKKSKKKEPQIKLKCKICHARFKTSESLKNHMASDTHRYECSHCRSIFRSERFLRRHLFIHNDNTRGIFKCEICKRSFRTKENLQKHIAIHDKEKPYVCEHCKKEFASKYRLKRHVAVHLNQNMECPFKIHLGCDKTFYRKDKLWDHINTHSPCKTLTCRICSKSYWIPSKLHEHMKKVHNGIEDKEEMELLKCYDCSRTFKKPTDFCKHHCPSSDKKTEEEDEDISDYTNTNTKPVSNIEIIMVPMESDEEETE